jgi:hypothetical protein
MSLSDIPVYYSVYINVSGLFQQNSEKISHCLSVTVMLFRCLIDFGAAIRLSSLSTKGF